MSIKDDFKSTIELLGGEKNLDIRIGNTLFEKIFINDGKNIDIYIKYFPKNCITISRVSFNEKRKSYCSKLLENCCKICKENNYNKIIIESALTEEMVNFCNKNNFIIDLNTAFEIDNVIYGNYILNLNIK